MHVNVEPALDGCFRMSPIWNAETPVNIAARRIVSIDKLWWPVSITV